MNFFGIPYLRLQAKTALHGHTTWSASQTFQALLDAEETLQRLRDQVAQQVVMLRRRRTEQRQAEESAWQQELAMRRRAMEEAVSAAKEKAIEEMITWHQEVSKIKEETYKVLVQRAKAQVVELLNDLFPSLPWEQLLIQQLQQTLMGQPLETIGSIQVHPDHLPALTKAFEGYTNCRLLPKSTLSPGTAILDTEYFSILIEIPDQLERLKKSLWEGEAPSQTFEVEPGAQEEKAGQGKEVIDTGEQPSPSLGANDHG